MTDDHSNPGLESDRPMRVPRVLAVEPMTCPPNAFRTRQSLVTLEPEGSWTGEWGIDPRPLAREAERRSR